MERTTEKIKLNPFHGRIRTFKAKIAYTVDKYHPDYLYIDNPESEQTYDDIYRVDRLYFNGIEQIIAYIKNDLRTIAGGGYSTAHTHNVHFEIIEQ